MKEIRSENSYIDGGSEGIGIKGFVRGVHNEKGIINIVVTTAMLRHINKLYP